jgi:hypothetical protein
MNDFSLNRAAWVPAAKRARRRRAQRFLAYRRSGRIAAATVICAAIGLPLSVAGSASATAVRVVASAASTGVEEKSSTTYKEGTASTSAKAVRKGQSVLVLGTVNSTTITATQVVVGYNAPASTETAKVVGQIPANWSAGSGTIVSGTTANEATEAALAAYPGAIVDRVAKLSNGDYNVHYIGVNWPRHVFESSTFKVVGAL